eukprot:6194533-Pleurochrysis_carterae.AAC.4
MAEAEGATPYSRGSSGCRAYRLRPAKNTCSPAAHNDRAALTSFTQAPSSCRAKRTTDYPYFNKRRPS